MDDQSLETGKSVPLNWTFPDDIISRNATNIVVQHSDHEFIISFFEAQLPVVLGSPERRQMLADSITEIEARCVGRIVVAPGRMPEFMQVLQENFDNYVAKHASTE